jgi:hypothetical protein
LSIGEEAGTSWNKTACCSTGYSSRTRNPKKPQIPIKHQYQDIFTTMSIPDVELDDLEILDDLDIPQSKTY